MEILKLIKERRSVRIFNGKRIPKKTLMNIIEAGVWAPTGCNNQEIKFLIIQSENELKKILRFKPFFKGVSTVILVFYDMSRPRSNEMYVKKKIERHLPYVDGGLALSNMALCAKNEGIDSCIFNLSKYHTKGNRAKKNIIKRIYCISLNVLKLYKYNTDKFEYYLRNEINIPNHLKIICGISLGYAKIFPNIEKEKHGGDAVMRGSIKKYIVGEI